MTKDNHIKNNMIHQGHDASEREATLTLFLFTSACCWRLHDQLSA